jgi:hypothetical protein
MKLRDFIRDQFKRRLDAGGCLVIYDGEGRYRECAADLACDACAFIDAGESIIAGREQALSEWLKMARPVKSKQQKQLVIYVPAPKPDADEDKCRDPFQIFALGGAAFPEGDGDSYQALCRRAKPDFAAQIEALFQAGTPDFDMVDNVGAGKGWPRLRTLLGVESAAESSCRYCPRLRSRRRRWTRMRHGKLSSGDFARTCSTTPSRARARSGRR